MNSKEDLAELSQTAKPDLESSVSEENISEIAYKLFTYNYAKKYKTERYGLLWGTSIAIIFLYKKNIARVWNNDEAILIKKINDIAMNLYKQIKKDLIKSDINIRDDDESNNNNVKSCSGLDGLHYLVNYLPELKNNPKIEYNNNYINDNYNNNNKEVKKINTKSK